MRRGKDAKDWDTLRLSRRVHSLREISISYEGDGPSVAIRPPDVSTKGMFVPTSQKFPEGAVLNLRFCLDLSGAEVQARGEVRYCVAGVGIGVEFIDISPQAVRAIEEEIHLAHRKRPGRRARRPR